MSLANTHFGYEYIEKLISSGPKKIFFSGIGGVSMNSLARVCMLRGHTVSGYDKTKTETTAKLEREGIKIYYESSPQIVKDCDIFVYTVAIPADDPAYLYAGANEIPRISRADFLGYVMMGYKTRIGISGMHGKSTTTVITSSIYKAANLDPTVFGGAEMKDIGTTNLIGGEEAFIFEACEYMDSFLDFYPTTSIVLNIEMDHVDYFKSIEQIKGSFSAFMAKSEIAVVNISDNNVMEAAKVSGTRTVTFGVERQDADYSAENIRYSDSKASFDIYNNGNFLCSVDMRVPGQHIVIDALAAAAAAHVNGVPSDCIGAGLSSYNGICRRMEHRGKTAAGADVYDDYAHHPTEISATLKTAEGMGYSKTICVFQPHTYSRTHELFEDFVNALSDTNVNEIILAPIYSAREVNSYGVSSEKLTEMISRAGKKCLAINSFNDIADYIKKSLVSGDAAFIIGAGDINKVSSLLID